MNYNGNEPFLFDLHEEITFRQGEEIDDLYGISIQPDVNILKESSYIQLRGVLMVSGDYQSLPREEPMYIMDQDDDENYVQQVKALDNGFTTFQYPIPVDITIPTSRVNETGEPDVEIEYFDYELPEPKSLHVYAKIRLANVEVLEEQEEVRQDEQVNSDFQLQEIPSFDEEEHELEEEYPQEESRPQEELTHELEETEEEQKKGREFWNKKETQSFTEFFNNKEKKAKAEEKPKVKESKENVAPNAPSGKENLENKPMENKPMEEVKPETKKEEKAPTKEKEKKKEKKAKQEEMEKEKEAKQEEMKEETKKAKKEQKETKKKETKQEAKKKEAKSKAEKDDAKQKKKDASPEVNEKSSKDPYDDDPMDNDDEAKKPKKKMFGLNYLSNFFRDGEEEQEPEKVSVKMRFVQENETLESIANSYSVTVSQLERLNGLDDDHQLKTGDVLYVPYK